MIRKENLPAGLDWEEDFLVWKGRKKNELIAFILKDKEKSNWNFDVCFYFQNKNENGKRVPQNHQWISIDQLKEELRKLKLMAFQ